MDCLKDLCERLETLERHVRRAEQRARLWRNITCCVIVVALVGLPVPTSTARENSSSKENRGLAHRVERLEDILRRLARSVKAIERKLMHITSGPNEVVINGANLRIVNGLGDTQTTNGLGNLIVGYNEIRNDPSSPDVRTGSHNIVVGEQNNFSSFGGLVVGSVNEISGDFASVTGGRVNTASGPNSSVTGGSFNIASSFDSSVSGGIVNTASGFQSSVTGAGLTRLAATPPQSAGEEGTRPAGSAPRSAGERRTRRAAASPGSVGDKLTPLAATPPQSVGEEGTRPAGISLRLAGEAVTEL